MKSAYEKYLIKRAEEEYNTFSSSATKPEIQEIVADILWDDLLIQGMYVWMILEATGDERYDENTFLKAAGLVMDDSFSLINLDSRIP